jgi:hypothetical protein
MPVTVANSAVQNWADGVGQTAKASRAKALNRLQPAVKRKSGLIRWHRI